MHEFENDEEMPISNRSLTTQQRVSKHRANSHISDYKTVKIELNRDEFAILDAIASKDGISRVLLVSLAVKNLIKGSGYFISGGKLITPTFI